MTDSTLNVFFQKKTWCRFLVVFLVCAFFQGVFFSITFASDNNNGPGLTPCKDAKGTGTYVPTGGANNAGKIFFDPDAGPPDFPYQACLYDPGNDGIGPFEVRGWAVDDNLGYISFYCNGGDNLGIACGGQNYGVIIDGPEAGANAGMLHGYAYGDNTGWINTSCIAGRDINNVACGNVDYYVRAEATDVACMGKVYSSSPPDPSCAAHPNNSVYAWSDSVEWINFTGLFFPLPGAQIPLPQVPEELNVAFAVTPDPSGLNKNTALIADNTDAYTLSLTFTKKSDNSPIDLTTYLTDHTISAQVTWLEDSVDMDQTDVTNGNFLGCRDFNGPALNCGNSAITKPLDFTDFLQDPNNPNVRIAKVKSIAPTSAMNGYDLNGDGLVDFPYQQFIFGAPNYVVPDSQLILGNVSVAVTQNSDNGCNFGVGGLCDLKTAWSGNQSFPFVPAIEVSQFDDAGNDFIETSNSEIENLHTNTVCRGTMADCNASSIFFQQGFGVQNPPYKFVIDSNGDLSFTMADDDFFIMMPAVNNFIYNYQASPRSGDPMMQDPAENAYVWTRVEYSVAGQQVKYFSNKLPRATGSYLVNPLAFIKGNAYSTGVTDPQGGMIIKPSSDVVTNILRDFIARNVSRIIAGVDDPSDGITSYLTSNGTFFVPGNGGSSGKQLLPDADGPRVYYFKGDVVLTGNGNVTWKGERTIITIGGNVFIDKNLYNQNLLPNQPKPKLGIIALKNFKTGKGGNVYIAPQVTDIQANMFMDGSLQSYSGDKNQINNDGEPVWSDDKTRHDFLMNQLAIEGSVASSNTTGGVLLHPPVVGNGGTEIDDEGSYGQNPNGRSKARLYDLNFLRYYGLVFERDPLTGDSKDQNGDNVITAQPTPDGDLISPPAGISQKSLMLTSDQKFATYILFDPATPTLPGFGVQGGLSIQQKP